MKINSLKPILIIAFILLHSKIVSQGKTLIPVDQEVDLPVDSLRRVGISTVFVESKFDASKLKHIFATEALKMLDQSYYHLIDSTGQGMEFFILYPCKSFKLENVQDHEIINEGLITSAIRIEFREGEYEISLSDFEWVPDRKTKRDLSQIYQEYFDTQDLKFKVRYFGVLKSAENSFVESINNFTLIISEIISQKSKG
jgi:hypothetical protein